MNWSINDIEELKKKGKIRDYKIMQKGTSNQGTPKKSKYGNKKTVVNEIEFDSKKEAMRYKALLMLLKAGKIGCLQRQVSYELNEGGTHSLRYVADFVYVDAETGETIVEDVKGFRNKIYLKKRRLMKKIHGITVREI